MNETDNRQPGRRVDRSGTQDNQNKIMGENEMSKKAKENTEVEPLQPIQEDQAGIEDSMIPEKLLWGINDVVMNTIDECCMVYNIPELKELIDEFLLYTTFIDAYKDNPEKWRSFYTVGSVQGIKGLNLDFPEFMKELTGLIMAVNLLITKKEAEKELEPV